MGALDAGVVPRANRNEFRCWCSSETRLGRGRVTGGLGDSLRGELLGEGDPVGGGLGDARWAILANVWNQSTARTTNRTIPKVSLNPTKTQKLRSGVGKETWCELALRAVVKPDT